jgi:CBS domain-containing protein
MTILVRHAMTEAPKTAKPDMNAADAAALMKQFDTGVIPSPRVRSCWGW